MQLLKQMLPSAALAAAVAAALLFIFACWWRSVSRCAGAIAIGAGYLAGHVLAAGWSPLPPRHAIHWLFWFAVIGVIAAAADAFVRPKRIVRLVTWAIICTIACRLILQPKFSYAWSAAGGWLRVFAIAAGVVVLTCCLDLVERRPFGTATLFSVTTVLGGGACIALILSGSLLLGQLACILIAIVAACFFLIIAVTAPFHPAAPQRLLVLYALAYGSAVSSMQNYWLQVRCFSPSHPPLLCFPWAKRVTLNRECWPTGSRSLLFL